MRLKDIQSGQFNAAEWESKGYQLPKFDIQAVRQKTYDEPTWVHFGGGNIFRAFPAAILNDALNTGQYDRGVIVAETFDFEVIDKAYQPYDNLSLYVALRSDGNIEKKVIASVTEALKADYQFEDWQRLKEIFRKESLQMISFTITEKGYTFNDADLEAEQPKFAMGKVCALLYERFLNGALPLTVQSMDNCSHNGDKVKAGIMAYAEKWVKDGRVAADFLEYLRDEQKVTFPWSMIDKITPRPHEKVKELLAQDGFEDNNYIETEKHTFTAPFVNAEEVQYLVIEDHYTNGRPPLHLGGALYTTRETVDKVETMKVCTCLNPLHTSLAVFGCILGYDKISAEMKDPELKKLVDIVGYTEGLPVVVNPGVIDPKEFIDTVLNVRIPNPFMPDTPQRIATDTSQKLAIRFGGTIKKYAASETLSVSDLKFIPLVLAGWCRYLMAVDDEGNAFTLSDDPLLETVCPYVASFKLGDGTTAEEAKAKLLPLLKDAKIFGVDLEEVGLADTVASYFAELIAGKGAVRATLKKYLA